MFDAGMFNFLKDFGNHDERKIDRFEDGTLIVDTCSVSDGDKQYETAVSHPEYNKGAWIIVEAYDTIDEAEKGHDRWVKTMTTEPLPEVLKDCCNSGVSQFGEAFGIQLEFPRKKDQA